MGTQLGVHVFSAKRTVAIRSRQSPQEQARPTSFISSVVSRQGREADWIGGCHQHRTRRGRHRPNRSACSPHETGRRHCWDPELAQPLRSSEQVPGVLWGRGQECCSTAYDARDGPHGKEQRSLKFPGAASPALQQPGSSPSPLCPPPAYGASRQVWCGVGRKTMTIYHGLSSSTYK